MGFFSWVPINLYTWLLRCLGILDLTLNKGTYIRTLSENYYTIIRGITWKLSKMVISVEKTHKTVWVKDLLGWCSLSRWECCLSADVNYGWLFPSRLTDNFHWLSCVIELKSHHNEWATRSKSICISGGTR